MHSKAGKRGRGREDPRGSPPSLAGRCPVSGAGAVVAFVEALFSVAPGAAKPAAPPRPLARPALCACVLWVVVAGGGGAKRTLPGPDRRRVARGRHSKREWKQTETSPSMLTSSEGGVAYLVRALFPPEGLRWLRHACSDVTGRRKGGCRVRPARPVSRTVSRAPEPPLSCVRLVLLLLASSALAKGGIGRGASGVLATTAPPWRVRGWPARCPWQRRGAVRARARCWRAHPPGCCGGPRASLRTVRAAGASSSDWRAWLLHGRRGLTLAAWQSRAGAFGPLAKARVPRVAARGGVGRLRRTGWQIAGVLLLPRGAAARAGVGSPGRVGRERGRSDAW